MTLKYNLDVAGKRESDPSSTKCQISKKHRGAPHSSYIACNKLPSGATTGRRPCIAWKSRLPESEVHAIPSNHITYGVGKDGLKSSAELMS